MHSGSGTDETDTRTDRDGRFKFEHVDPKAGDYTLAVKPGLQTQGEQIDHVAVNGLPIELALKQGFTAKAKVLDVETGKPIVNATAQLTPRDEKSAHYTLPIEAMTNSHGEFEAHGLEPIEYLVRVQGTYEPSAKILRDA